MPELSRAVLCADGEEGISFEFGNDFQQTIDIDCFNHELEREEKDSQFLEAKRKLIMEYAASLPSVADDEAGG